MVFHQSLVGSTTVSIIARVPKIFKESYQPQFKIMYQIIINEFTTLEIKLSIALLGWGFHLLFLSKTPFSHFLILIYVKNTDSASSKLLLRN